MANALTFNRRQTLAMSVSWLAAGGVLAGCSPQAPTFKSTDITGAAFAQDLKLTDHTGQVRTMAEGITPTSYTMDHSAGKYVFDTNGAVRLFSSYGTEPAVIAEDILSLLKSMEG